MNGFFELSLDPNHPVNVFWRDLVRLSTREVDPFMDLAAGCDYLIMEIDKILPELKPEYYMFTEVVVITLFKYNLEVILSILDNNYTYTGSDRQNAMIDAFRDHFSENGYTVDSVLDLLIQLEDTRKELTSFTIAAQEENLLLYLEKMRVLVDLAHKVFGKHRQRSSYN